MQETLQMEWNMLLYIDLILDRRHKLREAGYTNAVVKVRVLNNEVQYALICLYM